MLHVLNDIVGVFFAAFGKLFLRDQVAHVRQRLGVALERNRKSMCRGISEFLIVALITSEDRRFWRHKGIDLAAICRAMYRFIVERRLEGASTVEQQLVRTLTGYRELSVKRKLREIILACYVASVTVKRETAILYLSCAYYGWRMNSLGEACERLDCPSSNMSIRQACEIVARLKYPEPRKASPERRTLIRQRAEYIRQRITKEVLIDDGL